MVTAYATCLIRKAIIKSVIRAINYAKKTTYLSLMSFTKVTGKNALTQKYSYSKSTMDELYKIRKNYGIYKGKEMERYRISISINYFIFLNDIYLQYNFLENPQYLICTYLNTLEFCHQIMNLIRIF